MLEAAGVYGMTKRPPKPKPAPEDGPPWVNPFMAIVEKTIWGTNKVFVATNEQAQAISDPKTRRDDS